MKMKFLSLITILNLLGSCAMIYNKKEDNIEIKSNPPGAMIIVNGKNYGKTPSTISLVPKKDLKITVYKKGYSPQIISPQYWVSIKSKACMADVLTPFLVLTYYSYYWSGYCNEFKEDSYSTILSRVKHSDYDVNKKKKQETDNRYFNYYNSKLNKVK